MTAFLVPVSYSKWSGGVTSTNAQTEMGHWGVSVVNAQTKENLFYLTLVEADSVYDGAFSVEENTQINVIAAGTALEIDNSAKDQGAYIERSGNVYTLKNKGSYRINYAYKTKALYITYASGKTLDDIFNNGGDQALIDILDKNGMNSQFGGTGVRGCVTSSGAIIKIDNDGWSLTNFKAVVELKAGEQVALFGTPPLGKSTRISEYASGYNGNENLERRDTGYFLAKETGTYTISITYSRGAFYITAVSFAPAA